MRQTKSVIIFGEPDPSPDNPVFYLVSKRLGKWLEEDWLFISTRKIRKFFICSSKGPGRDRREDDAVYEVLDSTAKILAKYGYNLIITGVFPHKNEYERLVDGLKELETKKIAVYIKGCHDSLRLKDRAKERYLGLLKTHSDFERDLIIDLGDYQGDRDHLESRIEFALEKLLSLLRRYNVILLKGLAASVGKIRGRVKVIKSREDLTKIRESDVLVAAITNPSMVVSIQKASAIVTDHGGICSHPAIVARELSIPCVVGTREATRVLRDGMTVVVNGEEGIVYVEN